LDFTPTFRNWLAGDFLDSVFSSVKVKVWVALIFVISLMASASAADAEVTALSFDAKLFKEKFNSRAHQSRLIMILSPT
jgi:hypothetical protein